MERIKKSIYIYIYIASSTRDFLISLCSMGELCDLKVHINGQHTFFINQRIVCAFSGRLRKMLKQEKKRSHTRSSGLKIMGFQGGAEGFELVTRFCYSNGRIPMSPSNICLLHTSAIIMEMTEEVSTCNLLSQAETFLDGLFYWTWDEVLTALKNCEPFFSTADSSGLLHKLISSLLAKISANSEVHLASFSATPMASSSSSSSSPDTPEFGSCRSSIKTPDLKSFSATPMACSSSSSSSPDTPEFGSCRSSIKTPGPMRPCSKRDWWFEDLTVLAPNIVEKTMRTLGAYGTDNKNLILTKFLLHYLKTAKSNTLAYKVELGGLADTAVYGVVVMGRAVFSCRGLFWVLRVVSGLGLSTECRYKLERMMGLVLDQATLDDLLVSGNDGGAYDVSLVVRLVRVFVGDEDGGIDLVRMKKVGRLIDKYLGEISPDHSLKVTKFLSVAESLPDSARDCFDGVYRALDIYLEAHRELSFEERTRLCQCLNYEKLSLEACKDLAKNPRIPPEVSVQAMVSQQSMLQMNTDMMDSFHSVETPRSSVGTPSEKFMTPEIVYDKEELKLNLKRMQNRVIELEKVCKEMKGQMSKMGKSKSITSLTSHHSRMPRLC